MMIRVKAEIPDGEDEEVNKTIIKEAIY